MVRAHCHDTHTRQCLPSSDWPLNENTVNCSEMCNERGVLHEIWTIFRGDIAKRISRNLAVESILKFTVFSKLKTEKKKCNRQVQNVTGPESKHLQLPVRRSLYTTNLDAN